jgi:outer membrane protein insertion porin family
MLLPHGERLSVVPPSRAPIIRAGLWLLAISAPALSAGEAPGTAPANGFGAIRDVRIEGTNHYHPDRIRFLLTTRAGRGFDPQSLTDDVHAIESMGPFTNVRSEVQRNADGSVTVVFRVVELPWVSEVEFSGLNYWQKQGLDKVIQTKAGNNLNQAILDNDQQALLRHFQDKGYRYVQVLVGKKDDKGNIGVTFTVDLGREIEVAKVIFLGLPEHLFTKQLTQGLLNGEGSPYHQELMTFDEGAVRRAAQDLGWLDASLSGTRIEDMDYVRPLDERHRHGPMVVPDGEYNDSVVVVYELVPGERYYLGSVSFVGNTKATQEELRKGFALADGAPYKRTDIDKAIERARRVVSNQGYARAEFGVDRHLDLAKHEVHLVLHMQHEDAGRYFEGEGDLYHLARVDLRGNYQTKDAVVRRALALKPGDLWNDDANDESKRQIERTGLFKNTFDHPLRILPQYPDDQPGTANLHVDLDEDSTGTLNFQVGYSSASGVFVQAGFGERNVDLWGFFTSLFGDAWETDGYRSWRGGGQNVQVSVMWSRYTTSGGLSWTNQHLLDGPYQLTVQYNYIDSIYRPWEEVKNIPSVTLGRSFLRNDLNFSLGYAYTELHVENPQSDAPNDALDGSGKYYLNTWTLGQSFDRLNNPRIPTTGYLLGANQSLTGLIMPASTMYWEYNLRADQFQPLVEGEQGGITFLHTSARWRQIHGVGGDNYIPFYARYFGGGPSPQHRGFEQDHLSPTEINRNGAVALTGGTTDLLFSEELSFPVQDNNEGIRLALFCDYGNVWGAGQEIRLADMRTAIGFGVRFPIQLPVSLDFAWLFDARNGESSSQIQFTLGQVHF